MGVAWVMAAKQIIGNAVKCAQDFEEKKQEREAYQYYLYAIEQISVQLRQSSPQDSSSGCGIPPGTLFNLASRCLESAQQLFNQASEEKRQFATLQIMQSRPAAINRPNNAMTLPATINRNRSPTLPHDHQPPQRMMSDVSSTSSGSNHSLAHARRSSDVSTPAAFKRKPQVVRSNKAQYNVQPLHRISPMDEANKKNMHLMQQYKASLRRDSVKILGPQRQNLTLNYLRRMEENRSVARINEQALARKSKQREERLKQENQRVKLTTFRKSMDSLSQEDLIAEVALFEQGKANFQSVKDRLSNSSDSTNIVNELVNEVLSCCDHPLSKLLGECQFSITQFLQPLVRKIESAGRLPFCTISKDPTGSHNLSATIHSVSSYDNPATDGSTNNNVSTDNGSTNGNNSTDSAAETIQLSSNSLDQRLSALKEELEDTGKPIEEPKDTDSTFKEPYSSSSYHDDSGDEYFTMKTIEDDDDIFETLKEETDSRCRDSILNTVTSPQTPEQAVIFRGLVRVVCEPHYNIQSTFNKLAYECSGYLDGAVKLVRSAIDKMVASFGRVYPEVTIEDNSDECRNMVEESFFPAIAPLLLPIYRVSNYTKECTILKNMAEHCNDTPKEAGVRRHFWLENQDTAPYSNTIAILHHVYEAQTPRAKLEHLVSFSKSIIQCIEDYNDSSETKVDTGVGVDDILPIMTYIIIKSARPELISECSFMQDFIQECYSMGEEGFCLTSFDTAVRFVTQMSSR